MKVFVKNVVMVGSLKFEIQTACDDSSHFIDLKMTLCLAHFIFIGVFIMNICEEALFSTFSLV